MALEIERKYLVIDESYKMMADSEYKIIQGYLCRTPEHTVRVRIKDEKGFITIKGRNKGIVREEFEYEIPYQDAIKMLNMCEGKIIDKTRYIIHIGDLIWEVDEFHGALAPLIVAEVELPDKEYRVNKPEFIGDEVTGKSEYYNSNM